MRVEGRPGMEILPTPELDAETLSQLVDLALAKMNKLYELKRNLKRDGDASIKIGNETIELHKSEIIGLAVEYALNEKKIGFDTDENHIMPRPLYFGALQKELRQRFLKDFVHQTGEISNDPADSYAALVPDKNIHSAKPKQFDLPYTSTRTPPQPFEDISPIPMPDDADLEFFIHENDPEKE